MLRVVRSVSVCRCAFVMNLASPNNTSPSFLSPDVFPRPHLCWLSHEVTREVVCIYIYIYIYTIYMTVTRERGPWCADVHAEVAGQKRGGESDRGVLMGVGNMGRNQPTPEAPMIHLSCSS